jgi:2'-5' RNA ligase
MPDQEKIRAFIAIPAPRHVKDFLLQETMDLRRCRAKVKWVGPEAMHVTLKFLGQIPSDRLAGARRVCEEISRDIRPFSLRVQGLGAFPNISKPGVIWAGLLDEERAASRLASELDSGLNKAGFLKEKRPFKPHLTLGRTKLRGKDEELSGAIRAGMDMMGPEFIADRIVLYRSDLKPSGAEYSIIGEYPFGQ